MSATIIATGKIVDGEIHWQIAPLPPQEEVAPEGELQELIDYGAELAEYQDWIADQDYHRSGNW
jgi:hypothetical protein